MNIAILETLGITTNRKIIERKSFGIKEPATGYFIRSNRKEEEQAMLKEIKLMMIDIKRGTLGRVCMDTYNCSRN